MGDNEPLEGGGLADGPRLLAGRLVVSVQELGGYGIDNGDGDGHLGVESSVVGIV